MRPKNQKVEHFFSFKEQLEREYKGSVCIIVGDNTLALSHVALEIKTRKITFAMKIHSQKHYNFRGNNSQKETGKCIFVFGNTPLYRGDSNTTEIHVFFCIQKNLL